MREIKFKWFGELEGEKTKRMHDVVGIHWGAGVVELYEDEGSTYAIENGMLVQYTGLKDKNGREIYESDALKMHYGAVAIVRFGTGIFDSGVYQFTGWYLDFGKGIQGEDSCEIDPESCSRYEVLGNIHENPELLK